MARFQQSGVSPIVSIGDTPPNIARLIEFFQSCLHISVGGEGQTSVWPFAKVSFWIFKKYYGCTRRLPNCLETETIREHLRLVFKQFPRVCRDQVSSISSTSRKPVKHLRPGSRSRAQIRVETSSHNKGYRLKWTLSSQRIDLPVDKYHLTD